MNVIQLINEVITEYIHNPSNELIQYLNQHNIDFDDLTSLGSGDFGEAYSTGDGRVLKETRSQSEFNLATEIKNSDNPIYKDAFAEIYDTININGDMYILQEELEEDSKIEDLFNELQELLESEGLPLQYVHNLDTDEYDVNDELLKFIGEIEEINRAYRNLGIEASDIRPENLGRDKHGNVKAFDIDDKTQ
ncbi:MAG: hypothetical protein ACOC2W_01935 [bacterium]